MRSRLFGRKKESMSDVEKWNDVYRTLFPGEIVPNPCKYPDVSSMAQPTL